MPPTAYSSFQQLKFAFVRVGERHDDGTLRCDAMRVRFFENKLFASSASQEEFVPCYELIMPYLIMPGRLVYVQTREVGRILEEDHGATKGPTSTPPLLSPVEPQCI